MQRYLMSVFAVVALASAAGAQDSTKATRKPAKPAKTWTKKSAGAVDNGGGGPGSSTRAMPRDWVRADDTRGDDLWKREQMLDAKYGKDRERRP